LFRDVEPLLTLVVDVADESRFSYLLKKGIIRPIRPAHFPTTLALKQYDTKMRKPCNGVNIEYNMRKMANAIGSCISVMMNPNIHERPIEAKMEKYTLNSLDFSFLSALGADFNVSWISRAMKKKMTALAETMMKPGRKKDR